MRQAGEESRRPAPIGSPPGRRTVLLGAGAAVLTAVTGCDVGTSAPPLPAAPDPADLAVGRAVTLALALRRQCLDLATRPGTAATLATLLTGTARDHEAQVLALGGTLPSPGPTATGPTATGPTATGPTATGPTATGPTATPAGPTVTPAGLVTAHSAAATAALRDALTTSPATAGLLARVAAARAVRADAIATIAEVTAPGPLAPDPAPAPPAATPTAAASSAPPGGSPPTTAAATPPAEGVAELQRLLDGEHAAVFAYPVVIARCAKRRQAVARRLWDEHTRARDDVERALLLLRATPAAAAAAYDVGALPRDPVGAAALAARIERGLAVAALAAVTATPAGSPGRRPAAVRLVAATRAAAGWTGTPPGFAGIGLQTASVEASTPAGTSTPAGSPGGAPATPTPVVTAG